MMMDRRYRLFWGTTTWVLPLLGVLLLVLPLSACDHTPDYEKDPHVIQDGSDFPEDRNSLSPPIVNEPLYACATSVSVRGFIPDAKIEILADGTAIGGGVSDSPDGQRFSVSPALVEGQTVTATQTFDGVTSAPL